MLVEVRLTPAEVDPAISERVVSDVTAAMQSVTTNGTQFIVNDTLWYGKNRQGKVTAQVVNSAGYISKSMQKFLEGRCGWKKEKTLSGQTIDAYIELPSVTGFHMDRTELGKFLDEYSTAHPEASIDSLFHRYAKRGCFNLSCLDPKFHSYFKSVTDNVILRIGLEFETGNIASSFRALNKLNFLFRKNLIDAGVFITSKDKASTAAKIWPMSNRNGSFEELERRNFREMATFPMWEVSFAPDGIDRLEPYLGRDGKTYMPTNTGQTEVVGTITYEKWTGDGKELLRRV